MAEQAYRLYKSNLSYSLYQQLSISESPLITDQAKDQKNRRTNNLKIVYVYVFNDNLIFSSYKHTIQFYFPGSQAILE